MHWFLVEMRAVAEGPRASDVYKFDYSGPPICLRDPRKSLRETVLFHPPCERASAVAAEGFGLLSY